MLLKEFKAVSVTRVGAFLSKETRRRRILYPRHKGRLVACVLSAARLSGGSLESLMAMVLAARRSHILCRSPRANTCI